MALVGNISGSSQSNSVIGISGSVIVASRPDGSFPAFPGVDVTFFVSGSQTEKSSFGGALVVSGTLYSKKDLIVDGNATVSGDLNVMGATTTIDTVNLEVRDAVVGLGFSSGTIALTAGDRGWIGGLDTADNAVFKWDNSATEFAVGRTQLSSTGSLPITLTSYSNLHTAKIQASIVTASLGFSGSLTRLADGTSYLIEAGGVSITSASNGAVTIFAPVATVVTSPGDNRLLTSTGTSTGINGEANFTFDGSLLALTGSMEPGADITYNLGSADKRWANVYTGDLHLNNDRGNWTVIEEEENLTIRNNKSGKLYRFVLEAIDTE